jgi:MoxR-like ATPase
MYDVRALNELVAKESAFADRLLNEVGKVIVGQHYMVERTVGLLTGGTCPGRRSRPGQDAHRDVRQ